MGITYVRFAVTNPAHYRVMFGGFVDPKARQAELAGEAAQALDALVGALTELQRDGLVRGDDPESACRAPTTNGCGASLSGVRPDLG